jgi:hypothetical protein
MVDAYQNTVIYPCVQVMDTHISKANYYNESLCNVLAPACKNEIKKAYAKVALDPRNKLVILRAFQEELSRIKDREYSEFEEWFRFIMESKNMFWLPDLISKVLNELSIVCGVKAEHIPTVDPVIMAKSCLINAAREIWKQPYLLYDKFDRFEYCKNMTTLDSLVKAAIVRTIHDLIPQAYCENIDDGQSELIDIVEQDDLVSVGSACFSVASDSENNEEEQN